jgi:hypothetical protein
MCGTKIMASFTDDPKAPDTSCLAHVVPASFEPEFQRSQGLLGTLTPGD